jgi:serine protease Do
MRHRRWVVLVVAVLQVVVGGCVARPDPATTHAFDARLAAAALRVRVLTCEGEALASGFLIRPRQLVTNRHVVDSAVQITVDTWDGRLRHGVAMRQADRADVGEVDLQEQGGPVLELAIRRAASGDTVWDVGYPKGHALRVTMGRVIDYAPGAPYGEDGPVMRTSTEINLGNSGGPILDRHGHVIAIAFALERSTGYTLAIPAERIRSSLEHLRPVTTTCGTP